MVFVKKAVILLLLIAILWGSAGCQVIDNLSATETITPEVPAEIAETPDAPPEFVFLQGSQVRQWAIESEASSEFTDDEWSARQVIGAPDTRRCGDYQTAWAPAGSDETSWLEVKFPLAVHVTAVNIIQSFNPNQVVRVELVGAFDRSLEIYQELPVQIDQPCPYTLPILVQKTEGRFDTVRIYIDQSTLGLGWNEIDAVELVGETE